MAEEQGKKIKNFRVNTGDLQKAVNFLSSAIPLGFNINSDGDIFPIVLPNNWLKLRDGSNAPIYSTVPRDRKCILAQRGGGAAETNPVYTASRQDFFDKFYAIVQERKQER